MVGANLTNEHRQDIAHFLLQNSKNGQIQHQRRLEAAERWSCSVRTISTIWARVKQQLQNGEAVNARSRREGRCGRTKKPIDVEALMAVPLRYRRTCRSTAAQLQVGKSTIHRAIASKEIRSHTNAVHPQLSLACKETRLEWCLSKLECNMQFKPMENVIHIDEKWFYLTEATTRYILGPNEPEPYRITQSKHYIPKLMFLCAVSRPLLDLEGNVMFDGKIGVFPYVDYVPAKYTTVNRPRGTMIMKPMSSITRDIIRHKLIHELIPAIKQKWPVWATKNIFIQQDNAPCHIFANDPEFLAAATSDGFNIQLVCQPSKSPDLNILDLGFFASIQSLQQQNPSQNLDELLQAVYDAFQRYDPKIIDKIFLSLQCVMVEIMKCRGGNDFKLPHMGKDRLSSLGMLPHNLIVDTGLVRGCLEHMVTIGRTRHIQDLLISMEIV